MPAVGILLSGEITVDRRVTSYSVLAGPERHEGPETMQE
jgi:hypothetical protein